MGGRKLCPVGRVKGTEGASPGEEEALGTPSPPEGKREYTYSMCAPGQGWSQGVPQGSRHEPESKEYCLVFRAVQIRNGWQGLPVFGTGGTSVTVGIEATPVLEGRWAKVLRQPESSPTVRSSSSGSTGRVQPMEVSRAVT